MRAVEKFGALANATDEALIKIAYQTAKGPVSDFLTRYIDSHRDRTWAETRAELRSRFAEVVDMQYALTI